MRVCIGLLLVAALGCKKKPDSAAGSAAPAAPRDAASVAVDGAVAATVDAAVAAAAPLPAFCITEDEADQGFVIGKTDDKSVAFCFRSDEAPSKCAVVDLTSGAFTSVAPPPPEPAKQAPPPPDVSKLALPAGHEWQTATSPDGKTIAAVTDIEGKLFVVDAPTGKVRKVVAWGADGGCMEPPSFIGDNIYVQYNVCAGPGATGWIVSPDGKKLGSLQYVNPTGTFFPVGGTRYAFEDFNGSGFEIVDGKTGKSIKEIAIKLPDDCSESGACLQLRTGNLGIAKLPGGKLVQFMSQIAVVDPATMKVEKMIKWPPCVKAK